MKGAAGGKMSGDDTVTYMNPVSFQTFESCALTWLLYEYRQMVQVVDYGSVPSAARPLPLKANRAAFIRFAAVATLALGALAAVIMVGQARPGIFRFRN